MQLQHQQATREGELATLQEQHEQLAAAHESLQRDHACLVALHEHLSVEHSALRDQYSCQKSLLPGNLELQTKALSGR